MIDHDDREAMRAQRFGLWSLAGCVLGCGGVIICLLLFYLGLIVIWRHV